MASNLKLKVVAGAWTSVAGIAGFKLYRNSSRFEEDVPYLGAALQELSSSSAARTVLGTGDLKIDFWSRSCRTDTISGLARASFTVRGDSGSAKVFMSAKRSAQAQLAFEAEYDEDASQSHGFSFYLTRPWEIKRLIVDGARSFFGSKKASDSVESTTNENPSWNLDALFFLPSGDVTSPCVLLGSARSLPEYEAMCVLGDSDAKSPYSRRRLHIVLGTASAIALFAGGLRLFRSLTVSRTYGFVRRSVLEHPQVRAALGPNASISTSEGTFGKTYLDAKLRLIGNGTVADVEVAATRRSNSSQGLWHVAVARMSCAGRTHNLDKSYLA